MKSIRNSKGLYWGLIIAFFALYILVGFVSTLHSITFFELANTVWMAVLLGITYEIGQAAVLFSILMSDNSKKILPWLLMFLLTALQVTANVYASFKFMDSSGSNDWTFWQRSILFWLEADGPEMFKVVISWISGALLPVVALGMTALVAENLKLKDEQAEEKEKLGSIPYVEAEHLKEKYIKDENIEDNEELYDIQDKLLDDAIPNKILENELPDKPEPKNEEEELVKNILESGREDKERLAGFAKVMLANKYPSEKEAKIIAELKKQEKEGLSTNPDDYEPVPPPRLVGDFPKNLIDSSVNKIVKSLTKDIKETPMIKLGEKIEKTPVNHPRGWHLKKEFIDDNGDVYYFGKFQEDVKPELPKKA